MSEPSFIPYSSYTPDGRGIHPLSSSPGSSSALFMNSPPLNGNSMLFEEVTTIFVVGFPEDMQEREFQNMFMFSPGFEAASLKWHCKDQDDDSATSLNTSLNNNNSNNGKKQMIGFARFRSRLEALEAVDVISGKKVDQDKGLVLKAEMAKKNLHVKRGSIVPITNTTTTTSDTTPTSSSPLESLPPNAINISGNPNNGNNHHPHPLDSNGNGNNLNNTLFGYHEPFTFSPLPSDLLSPMVDYKSDPFAMAAEQTMTPTTPVFNNSVFGFRSYSIDGRNSNNNNNNTNNTNASNNGSFNSNSLGIAPRSSISSNTSYTQRLSIKQQHHHPLQQHYPHHTSSLSHHQHHHHQQQHQHLHQQQQQQQQQQHHHHHHQPHPMSVPEEVALDPFHYLSKSSPVPVDRIGSYFSEDAYFGSSSNNGNGNFGSGGLRSDFASLSITQTAPPPPPPPQRSNSLMLTSPPHRPLPMTINHSGSSTNTNGNSGISNNSSSLNGINSSSNNNSNTGNGNGSSSTATTNNTNNTNNVNNNNNNNINSNTNNSNSINISNNNNNSNSNSNSNSNGNGNTNANNNGNISSSFISNMMMMTTPNLADQNPPCNTLYVGNLPPNTNEDELRQLFSKCNGYKRMYFRTKPQGPMCFVEFDDVMCATQIMAELQGHTLSNSVKGGIRLSFSKNPLFTKPNKTASTTATTTTVSSSSSTSSSATSEQQRTIPSLPLPPASSQSREFIFDPSL